MNAGAVRWRWIGLVCLLPFLGYWLTGLTDLDEGFYGAVTWEMNSRGEWIIPFLGGQPWFEKPILLYWLAKPCLWLFGPDYGPRLPSVIASLGTLILVAQFARRRVGDGSAALAVLILSGSLLFVAVGRMMLTDSLLVFFLTGAIFAFWESLELGPKWRVLSGQCLGFAMLAKGPVAVALFVLVAGWTYWRQPSMRPGYRGGWLGFAASGIAVASLWYLPVYLARPDGFVQEFVVRQNLGRFLGGDAAHAVPPPVGLMYYLPILLVGMLPWSLWIPSALRRNEEAAESGVQRFLAAWAVIVLVFYTASSAKLPHYVLAALPPLSLLIALRLSREGKPPVRLAAVWVVLIAVIANLGFWAWYHGLFPGTASQAEAHAIARQVANRTGDVVVFQMGKRSRELGTGSLKVQETSLPSLRLYVGRELSEEEDWGKVLAREGTTWVITRIGRVGEAELSRASEVGRTVSPEIRGEHFILLRVEPSSTAEETSASRPTSSVQSP